MKKIVCVSLNPAVDKILKIPRLLPGQLHRVESSGVMVSPGGKAVNVAKVCSVLGGLVHIVGFVAGNTGKMIESHLQRLGTSTDFVWLEGETRTNLNIISNNGETEILEMGPRAGEEELDDVGAKLESLDPDIVVFSGGLPPGLPEEAYFQLGKRVQGAKIVLDSSGQALKEGLRAGPFLVKPNLNELQALTGRTLEKTDYEGVLEACSIVVREYKAKNVVASMGAAGGVFYSEKQKLIAIPPKIDPVNTIGSGDAMVAGMVIGMAREYINTQLLKLGISCGVSNALQEAVGEVSKNEVERFMELVAIEEL